ncbi:MAG: type II toxin-antitoxin system VapC family toxin [Rickettsiales bacterium]|nr:type II toxin-antitoxin system VapC family toxin [Rickettsiales bacterium]
MEAKKAISDPTNMVFVSVTSIWEIEIKKNLGKLEAPRIDNRIIDSCRFNELPINIKHVLALKDLAPHHNDPFDRLLICQTIVEKFTLITEDKLIEKYDIVTL